MKGKIKKLLVGGLVAIALMGGASSVLSDCSYVPSVEAATKKPTLNKKKLTMRVGKTFKLKVKKGGKVKKWKTSNKKVVSVSKSGKLKARKIGKAKITAVLKSGKKAVCRVTVKKKVKDNSSRVLPNGKKQSIDSLKFYGGMVGGYAYLPKNTEEISRTLFNMYYTVGAGVEVKTTNIALNKLTYKWSISNPKVYEIAGDDNKRVIRLRPMGAGETYITVTVSYDGLSKTITDKFQLIDAEESRPKPGVQEPEEDGAIYMFYIPDDDPYGLSTIFSTGMGKEKERELLSKYSPEFKKFLTEYYEPVRNDSEFERLSAICRFLTDSNYTYNESMYNATGNVCGYSLNLLVQNGGPRKAWSGGFWYLCYLSDINCRMVEEVSGYSWNIIDIEGFSFAVDPICFSSEYASKNPKGNLLMYQVGNTKAFRGLNGTEEVRSGGQMSYYELEDWEKMFIKEDIYAHYQEEYPYVLSMDMVTKTFRVDPEY